MRHWRIESRRCVLALQNIAEREEKRAKILAHPGWQGYLDSVKGMIDRQSIRILKPAAISSMV
nr:NIPSNAP family protein [Mesorhizobium sp.]